MKGEGERTNDERVYNYVYISFRRAEKEVVLRTFIDGEQNGR